MLSQLAVLSASLNAEPLRLTRPETTFHAGTAKDLSFVVDGVAAGPLGWSPAPKVSEPQALVVECERPVEADELDIDLFFLAGRPWNALAEFSVSFTTDPKPSLHGNWRPIEVSRFAAEVNTLRRTPEGRLHLDYFTFQNVGNQPDDVYHLSTRLPGGHATGFRLDAFPVHLPGSESQGLSWWPPHDFTLTEFRVAVHVRQTTNIALHQQVTASHPLFDIPEIGKSQSPSNLTDGLPATIAHPKDPGLGKDFHFDIDLGRVVNIDHIGLRNRGEDACDRMSRLRVKWFDQLPAGNETPNWQAFLRADGSHPPQGAVDLVRAHQGHGTFRGRYLRIFSESSVPLSPQLAEVEVYETRTPVLVSAWADGREIHGAKVLEILPGARRVALELKIPQIGMPPDEFFRWRIPGDVDAWQTSSRMTIEMACPQAGNHIFEAQARHSDNEWDATVLRFPIFVHQYWWENRFVQASGFLVAILAAVFLSRLAMHRRTERQVAAANARAALADERARIARDLHDEIGANLTHISILSTLASEPATTAEISRQHNLEVASCARETIQAFDEILWSVNPKNDTLPSLCQYVCRRAEELLTPAGVSCRFHLHEPLPNLPLAPNSRHQLLLAVKETLHNIVKHARARLVQLSCEVKNQQYLRIEIQDDGCGFDPSASFTAPGSRRGMGLEDIRHRLTSLGGECLIESKPDQGTVVTFLLPL